MKATPKTGSVRDVHGNLCVRAYPESYPLYAQCAECGANIKCEDGTAEWMHTSDYRGACYLGSEDHLTHLGTNYAECNMPREIPAHWAGSEHEQAFYRAYDAYVVPCSGIPFAIAIPEQAIWAMDASGDDRVSRFMRDISSEADEYVSNADWGESVSFLTLTDEDRTAIALLASIDRAQSTYTERTFVTDWDTCVFDPTDWDPQHWGFCVLYVASSGIAYPTFYADESEAREDYEARASEPQYREDEDEESEEAPDICKHGTEPSSACPDPDCNGNVLLSEVRDAELWGGTE
jgi:hypothetical protein